MKNLKYFGLPLLFTGMLLISTLPFQSCEPEDCDDDDTADCDSCNTVRKPNIYFYPTELIQLEVNLDFPLGGEIIASIPEYGTGWDVTVDNDGLIDDSYTYLFYESVQPDIWQQTDGWLMNRADLQDFFTENMAEYGFQGQEIQDYIDYWIPRLKDAEFYAIYPQTSEIIEEAIEISFSIEPNNVLRLFYVIKGYNDIPNVRITEPDSIEEFLREGFYVTEWGVIRK